MVITQGNHVNVTWSTDLQSDVNLAESLRNWTAVCSRLSEVSHCVVQGK
jgi:hypothetical protein